MPGFVVFVVEGGGVGVAGCVVGNEVLGLIVVKRKSHVSISLSSVHICTVMCYGCLSPK